MSTHCIETFSGRTFDLAHPKPATVCIQDIAHATSNICRYTGHCHKFMSVAEHLVVGLEFLPRKYHLVYILHDAHESYCHDLSRPLKALLPAYRVLENKCQRAVYFHFMGRQMNARERKVVKEVDDKMLLLEAKTLMTSHGRGWSQTWTDHAGFARRIKIHCWAPKIAEHQFLAAWQTIEEGLRNA